MSKEVKMDCPFCGKENHLYYNPAKGVFYCFRCGKSGHANELRRHGVMVQRSDRVLYENEVSYRLGEGLADPPEYKEITTSSGDYLHERGVHASVLRMLRQKIYETNKGLLFFYPDADYWQERRWSAFSPPRWVNPSVAPRSPAQGVVYHLRTQYESPRVVLVEGIFDALRVAPFANVAALLSSEYHDNQLRHLASLGYTHATCVPDRDVSVGKRIQYLGKCGAWFSDVGIFTDLVADDPGNEDDEVLRRLQ
jgi:hypothetical protein